MKIVALVSSFAPPSMPGMPPNLSVAVVLSREETQEAIMDYLEKHGLGFAGSGNPRILATVGADGYGVRVELAPDQWVNVNKAD